MSDDYGQGSVGSIVKKKTIIVFDEQAPLPISTRRLLASNSEKFGGYFDLVAGSLLFRGTRLRMDLEDFYIRVSYGFWYKAGMNPNTMASIYEFAPKELPSWVSVQAGSDWIEVTCPDYVFEEKTWSGDDSAYAETISLNYLPKDGYDPPPFPYDPNNPNPPQPPQGVENLYCKVNGEIRQAKQLYTKQNGVIVPVKKIIGG